MTLVTGLTRLQGQIMWCVHMGNFSPVDQDEFKKRDQNGVIFIALWTVVMLRIKLIHIFLKWKYIQDQNYAVRAKLFCLKSFVLVTGWECSYWKIFILVTEISIAKTKILVTGPAKPLISTHRSFYKEKSGESRSRKPSQPG